MLRKLLYSTCPSTTLQELKEKGLFKRQPNALASTDGQVGFAATLGPQKRACGMLETNYKNNFWKFWGELQVSQAYFVLDLKDSLKLLYGHEVVEEMSALQVIFKYRLTG